MNALVLRSLRRSVLRPAVAVVLALMVIALGGERVAFAQLFNSSTLLTSADYLQTNAFSSHVPGTATIKGIFTMKTPELTDDDYTLDEWTETSGTWSVATTAGGLVSVAIQHGPFVIRQDHTSVD